MAVTAIVQKPDGKNGTWNLDQGVVLSASVYARMTKDTGPEAVLRSLGLNVGDTYRYPLVGTPTETNARLYLNSMSIDSVDEDGCGAHVTAVFTALDPSKDEKGPVDEDGERNPFAAPPTLRGRGVEEMLAVPYDRSGTAILNSAGDPFDGVPEVPLPVLTFEVSRLERAFDSSLIRDIQGRINDATWYGWPAGSVLCREISATRTWVPEVGGWGWDVNYVFAVKESEVASGPGGEKIRPGWRLQVLDAGFRANVDGEKGTIKDPQTFQDVTAPWPLNGEGLPNPVGDPPVYLEYDIYPTADFSALDLPEDLFSAGTPAEEE